MMRLCRSCEWASQCYDGVELEAQSTLWAARIELLILLHNIALRNMSPVDGEENILEESQNHSTIVCMCGEYGSTQKSNKL